MSHGGCYPPLFSRLLSLVVSFAFCEPVLHFPSVPIHTNIFSAYWTPRYFPSFCFKANFSQSVHFKPLWENQLSIKCRFLSPPRPTPTLGFLNHSGKTQDSAGVSYQFSDDFTHTENHCLSHSQNELKAMQTYLFPPYYIICLPTPKLHHWVSTCGPGVPGNP